MALHTLTAPQTTPPPAPTYQPRGAHPLLGQSPGLCQQEEAPRFGPLPARAGSPPPENNSCPFRLFVSTFMSAPPPLLGEPLSSSLGNTQATALSAQGTVLRVLARQVRTGRAAVCLDRKCVASPPLSTRRPSSQALGYIPFKTTLEEMWKNPYSNLQKKGRHYRPQD